ncbi:MAG: GMC family oxidoreductase [Cumulibacter sp.]
MIFDFLVVGAGAAGCAAASRLAANPRAQVLLLESGGRRAPAATHVPRAMPFALRSAALTSYPTLGQHDGDVGYWVRGRGIGGSTLVNGMMYVRGEPAAYEEFESAGNTGWGWSAFRAAFEEIEARLRPSHSTLNALDELALEAVAATGVPIVADVNALEGPRAGAMPATIHRGVRRSAAALLKSAGPNLRVLPGATAQTLLWQGSRVIGARVRRGSTHREIHARNVVVCAGTIETPLLLERSGIGRADVLHAARIPLRIASPRLGERIAEQRGVGLQLRLRSDVADAMELGSTKAIVRHAARYAVGRGGAIARPAYDAVALLALGGATVDTQMLIAPFALASRGILRPAGYPGMLLAGYPLRSTTSVSVHVNPADPFGVPIIDASEPLTVHDLKAQHATLAALRQIADTSGLGEVVTGADHAGPDGPGSSIYHAVGSAAMGPDADAAVDCNLRVRGTAGLHVADLSALPHHPSGGTAAVAMAIGWIAGDRIGATGATEPHR